MPRGLNYQERMAILLADDDDEADGHTFLSSDDEDDDMNDLNGQNWDTVIMLDEGQEYALAAKTAEQGMYAL